MVSFDYAKCRESLTFNFIPAEWRGFFIDSVTCRADQSVVVPTHSKAEERSDETSTKSSAIAAIYSLMPDPRANVEQPEVWPGMGALERGDV